MSTRPITALALLALAACAKSAPEVTEQRLQPAAAAPAVSTAKDSHAAFDKLAVDAVASLLEAKKAVAVDANGADTRKEYGTLPGAVLLSSARTFEAGELPADKSTELVFYCGSEQCNAAPKAATRAKELGYTAVKVMPEGIRGWVASGKSVSKPGV
jgi:rhodanese-related sulfurtransferase